MFARSRHTPVRLTLSLALALVCWADADLTSGQLRYRSGQTVAPVFEGWERNPDGSFDMVFGYLNRNYEEVVDIPVGPDNNIEPGGPDQGQPTHFLTRHRHFAFRVTVPPDFGNNELVWTLTTRGHTEQAYATLITEYEVDKRIIMQNNAGISQRGIAGAVNEYPNLRVIGDRHRTAKVGQPFELTAFASDDGHPASTLESTGQSQSATRGRRRVYGLRVGWFVYRGAGTVTFDPEQIIRIYPPDYIPPPVPPDGIYATRATFNDPGDYVLRVMADDVGLQTTDDVDVSVVP